jgi:alpha-beta hydrolase superfamily lysophospholipase
MIAKTTTAWFTRQTGTRCSVNGCLKKLRPLVERYKTKYRIKDVSTKYYDGARHDLLNEVNTDEVARDILAWMDARLYFFY